MQPEHCNLFLISDQDFTDLISDLCQKIQTPFKTSKISMQLQYTVYSVSVGTWLTRKGFHFCKHLIEGLKNCPY